jgi:hypothetical protein
MVRYDKIGKSNLSNWKGQNEEKIDATDTRSRFQDAVWSKAES